MQNFYCIFSKNDRVIQKCLAPGAFGTCTRLDEMRNYLNQTTDELIIQVKAKDSRNSILEKVDQRFPDCDETDFDSEVPFCRPSFENNELVMQLMQEQVCIIDLIHT